LSGPQTTNVLSAHFPDLEIDPLRDRVYQTQISLHAIGFTDLDQTLPVTVMVWPTKRSYTGSPSAELHMLGAAPLLQSVIEWISDSGQTDKSVSEHAETTRVRMARPGEFTMRSFLAGRLDLPQAEAVLGVIDAVDPVSLDASLSQLAGNLSRPMSQLRDKLLNLLADVEAGLDFVDENIQFIDDTTLLQRLDAAHRAMRGISRQIGQRAGDHDIPRMTLRGPANVGKSCLANALAGRPFAIVADLSGTTRDTVQTTIKIGETDVRIIDTAGIETNLHHDAELRAITRAAQSMANQETVAATLRLLCVDAAGIDWRTTLHTSVDNLDALDGNVIDDEKLSPSSIAQFAIPPSIQSIARTSHVVIATKSDLLFPDAQQILNDCKFVQWEDDDGNAHQLPLVTISVRTNNGMAPLKKTIADLLQQQSVGTGIGTAARCKSSIETATQSLNAAMNAVQEGIGHEWVAEEMRHAIGAVSEMTGAVYTDDLLDRVFSRFCIGK
ncbi:MAG: GTPase, partial [Planctomycetota bacterium]